MNEKEENGKRKREKKASQIKVRIFITKHSVRSCKELYLFPDVDKDMTDLCCPDEFVFV